MSHHLSLASLIVDFKRANAGSNIDTSSMLSVICPIAAAYVPPLAPGGENEGLDIYNKIAAPYVNSILSDVGELSIYNTGNVANIAKAIYINRYQNAYCASLAFNLPSVNDIVKALVGELYDVSVLTLWYPRFLEVFKLYYQEMQTKGA